MTLGRRGVLALIDGKPLIVPGRAVKAVDTTGAGDCFVGAVAAQLAGGKSIHDALDYANAAASICVQRMGAAPSMPSAEVEARSFVVWRTPTTDRDLQPPALRVEGVKCIQLCRRAYYCGLLNSRLPTTISQRRLSAADM